MGKAEAGRKGHTCMTCWKNPLLPTPFTEIRNSMLFFMCGPIYVLYVKNNKEQNRELNSFCAYSSFQILLNIL